MTLELLQADITTVAADAIVNAANSSLLGGGGVDGAIHRKGGAAILEACKEIRARQGGCKTGEAVITTAGRLPAKYVIHTVGPVWNASQPEEMQRLLRSCYENALKLAEAYDVKTIAFPNISTGVYHFPKKLAAEIAVSTVRSFEGNGTLQRVSFVCYDEENYRLYKQMLA